MTLSADDEDENGDGDGDGDGYGGSDDDEQGERERAGAATGGPHPPLSPRQALVSAGLDGSLTLWDLRARAPGCVLDAGGGAIWSLAVDELGSGGADGGALCVILAGRCQNSEEGEGAQSMGPFDWFGEEHLLVLEGELTVQERTPDGRRRSFLLRAGELIAWPANTGIAHACHNASDAPVRFLAVSDRPKGEICHYPDSGKTMIRALRGVGSGTATNRGRRSCRRR